MLVFNFNFNFRVPVSLPATISSSKTRCELVGNYHAQRTDEYVGAEYAHRWPTARLGDEEPESLRVTST